MVDRQDKPNLHAHKPDSPSIKRTPAGTHGKRRCHRSDKTAPPTPWEGKRHHLLNSAGARAPSKRTRRALSHPRWTPDSRHCSGKQQHSPRTTRQPTSSMQRARYNSSPTQVRSVILSVQVKGNTLIHITATQRTSLPHSRKLAQQYKAGARGAPNPGHNSAARTRGPPHTRTKTSGEQQTWPTCNYAEHRVHKRGHQRPTQTDKSRRRNPKATHTETEDHTTEDASSDAQSTHNASRQNYPAHTYMMLNPSPPARPTGIGEQSMEHSPGTNRHADNWWNQSRTEVHLREALRPANELTRWNGGQRDGTPMTQSSTPAERNTRIPG